MSRIDLAKDGQQPKSKERERQRRCSDQRSYQRLDQLLSKMQETRLQRIHENSLGLHHGLRSNGCHWVPCQTCLYSHQQHHPFLNIKAVSAQNEI